MAKRLSDVEKFAKLTGYSVATVERERARDWIAETLAGRDIDIDDASMCFHCKDFDEPSDVLVRIAYEISTAATRCGPRRLTPDEITLLTKIVCNFAANIVAFNLREGDADEEAIEAADSVCFQI